MLSIFERDEKNKKNCLYKNRNDLCLFEKEK